MNSNDHVVEKVAFMENAMADLKPSILQEQKESRIKSRKIMLKARKMTL